MSDNGENRLFLGGWICVWRKITNSTLWLDERFTKGQAWIDLLLLAQGVYNSEVRDGVYREFYPGHVYWSLSALAQRWKWNRKTVKTFLDNLVKAEMIRITSQPRLGTVITITNWPQYQERYRNDWTWENANFSKNADMGNGQKSEKCGQMVFGSSQAFDDTFSEANAQMTGQITGQMTGQMSGHNITKINKEKKKKNNIMSTSEGSPPPPPTPLLKRGGGDGSSVKTKADIPEMWRDDFDTYEDYWRWRNQ
jgi:hypothetical protein